MKPTLTANQIQNILDILQSFTNSNFNEFLNSQECSDAYSKWVQKKINK